jgi:hypothetical protein
MKRTQFVEVALIMVAVNTSETSVSFYEATQRNIPEFGHLYTIRPRWTTSISSRVKTEHFPILRTAHKLYIYGTQ